MIDNNRAELFVSDSNSIIHLLFIANDSTILKMKRKLGKASRTDVVEWWFWKGPTFHLNLHAIRLRDRCSPDNVIDMAFIYLFLWENQIAEKQRTFIVFSIHKSRYNF